MSTCWLVDLTCQSVDWLITYVNLSASQPAYQFYITQHYIHQITFHASMTHFSPLGNVILEQFISTLLS